MEPELLCAGVYQTQRSAGVRKLLALLLFSVSACGAPLPRWEWAGEGIPLQAGVISVVVASGNPSVIYAAAYEPGGFYRSRDSGDSWVRAAVGLEDAVIYSTAVHPLDWRIVAAATATGAYLTQNGGDHWVKLRGLPNTFIYSAVFAPDGSTLYLGTEGAGVYACRTAEMVCREEGLAGKSILSMAMTSDGTLVAGTAGDGVWIKESTWHRAPSPLDKGFASQMATAKDGSLYVLRDQQAWVSRDGGKSWRELSPEGGRFLAMGVNFRHPDEVYLGTGGGEIFVTHDGGRNWRTLPQGPRRAEITCIAVSEDSTLYLGTRWGGLYRLKGEQLTEMGVGKPVVTSLTFDPRNPSRLYAGTLHGVYVSRDGGLHWELITGGAGRIYVYDVALVPQCPPAQGKTEEMWIYVGAHDGIYISRDGGGSWEWATGNLGAITVFNITPHPEDPCTVYAGNWGNNILLTTDGGRTWAPVHRGLETLSVHSFAIAPWDSGTLFAGTVEAIYKSTDGGNSWRAVRKGMRDKITTFSLLARADGTIYAGTTDGVYISRDKGETWERAGLEGMTVTALASGSEGENAVYAGTEHHGLFRSLNGGRHWGRWGDEFRSSTVYDILPYPGGILVGGEMGIYRMTVGHQEGIVSGSSRGLFREDRR